MLEQLSRIEPFARNALRIVAGFMFWTHGGQKLFAWFGREETVELASRFGIAGVLEFFLAPLLVVGLFTRPVALILATEMTVAYVWVHTIGAGTIWHWANRGELAALYGLTWLFFAASGPGSWSLDAWRARRRMVSTP